MKKLLFLFLTIMLFSSCLNQNNELYIVEMEQTCKAFEEEAKQVLKMQYNFQEWIDKNGKTVYERNKFLDIFYSPKLNTCIIESQIVKRDSLIQEGSVNLQEIDVWISESTNFFTEKVVESILVDTSIDGSLYKNKQKFDGYKTDFNKHIIDLKKSKGFRGKESKKLFDKKVQNKKNEIEKDKKDKEDIKEKTFWKNQECLEQKDAVLASIKKQAQKYGKLNEEWELESLFYSKKVNNCVYIRHIYEKVKPLKSFFFSKSLYAVNDDCGSCHPKDSCDSFEDWPTEIRDIYEEGSFLENTKEERFNNYDKIKIDCNKFDQRIENEWRSIKTTKI
jgi:hypothetical protein